MREPYSTLSAQRFWLRLRSIALKRYLPFDKVQFNQGAKVQYLDNFRAYLHLFGLTNRESNQYAD